MFTAILYSKLHWAAKVALSALLCAGIVYAAFEFIYPSHTFSTGHQSSGPLAIGEHLKERQI